ncbi:MAG: DUF2283 domain-containing protein [bacterium]|jgi:uncharacterized protein YuzE
MRITFDKEADAVYIYLKEGPVARTKDAGDGILLDEDDNGEIIGIELRRFSTRRHPDKANGLSVTVEVGS